MQELEENVYNNFVSIFGNIQNMYLKSKDVTLFKSILYQNKIFFSNVILEKLLDSNLKIQSRKLYLSLQNKGILVEKVKVVEKYFFTCVYGNLDLLYSNKKKGYFYYSTDISQYGIEKYNYFSCNNLNYINVCTSIERINKQKNNIVIININNISQIRSFELDVPKDNLYIFSVNNEFRYLYISDFMLLVEAKYEKNIVYLTDNMLSNGKDILVIPGDVWDRNCFFSNFLISNGAGVILHIKDLEYFI